MYDIDRIFSIHIVSCSMKQIDPVFTIWNQYMAWVKKNYIDQNEPPRGQRPSASGRRSPQESYPHSLVIFKKEKENKK